MFRKKKNNGHWAFDGKTIISDAGNIGKKRKDKSE